MANKPLESQQYFADNIPVPVPIPSLNSWDDQILSLTKMAILHDFNFLFLLKSLYDDFEPLFKQVIIFILKITYKEKVRFILRIT